MGAYAEIDGEGWRIPREGSLTRKVYDLARQGKTPAQIARETGISRGAVRVHLWKMKHPDAANARAAREYRRRHGLPPLQQT